MTRAAEAHLVEMEARYRGLLEAAPDAMVVVDERGEIVLVNLQSERQFGYPRDELLGQPVTSIIPTGFAERLVADGLRSAKAALEQQIGTGIELVARRRDGTEFPVEIMLSPLESTEGILVTAAIRDITVRRAAEQLARRNIRLEERNRDLLEFASVVSHDIRAPLRRIQLFAERLIGIEGDEPTEDEAHDYATRIRDGAARLDLLVTDLVTYARLGESNEPRVRVDLGPLVEDVVADLALEIRDSGGRVSTHDLPAVHGDPTMLRLLLANLVANGLKFHRDGIPPAVDVAGSTEVDGSGRTWATIVVRDEGVGFDDRFAAKIFEIFERLDAGNVYPGTGVGLSICRKVADRHGGTIEAHGHPGKGATFTVRLPTAPQEATAHDD